MGGGGHLAGTSFQHFTEYPVVSQHSHATFLLQKALHEVESGSTFCNDAFLAIEQCKHPLATCLTTFL